MGRGESGREPRPVWGGGLWEGWRVSLARVSLGTRAQSRDRLETGL